jgi:transposase
VIPEPVDQTRHRPRRGSRGGRPITLDFGAYPLRNTVERAVNKLRGYRAVATRYGIKRDYVYRGTVDVAAIGIWLRDPVT